MLLQACSTVTGVAIHEYGLNINNFIIRRQITYLLGKSLLHCLLGKFKLRCELFKKSKDIVLPQ